MIDSDEAFWSGLGTRIAVIAALLASGSFSIGTAVSSDFYVPIRIALMISAFLCLVVVVFIIISLVDRLLETDYYKVIYEGFQSINANERQVSYALFSASATLFVIALLNDSVEHKPTTLAINGFLLIGAIVCLGFMRIFIIRFITKKCVAHYLIALIAIYAVFATLLVSVEKAQSSKKEEDRQKMEGFCYIIAVSGNTESKNMKICSDWAQQGISSMISR